MAFINHMHVGFVDVFALQIERDFVSQIILKIQLFQVKLFSLFINVELAFLFLSQYGSLIVIRCLSSKRLGGIIGSSSCTWSWKDFIVLLTKFLG